jgi:catechol 2,3-dioxygenase-like lactoylglutathione lyase family enzyme
MKLKNVLIVVKDIERARQFYHDLFGLQLILDNGGNMILTEGLVLQEEKYWKQFLEKEIIPRNNASELYFEEKKHEEKVSCSVCCRCYGRIHGSCCVGVCQ